MTAPRIGGSFGWTAIRKEPDINIHDMEPQMVINISECRAAATYSEPEVRVFPKQLNQLTKLSMS